MVIKYTAAGHRYTPGTYDDPIMHDSHKYDEVGIMRPNCIGCRLMFAEMLDAVTVQALSSLTEIKKELP